MGVVAGVGGHGQPGHPGPLWKGDQTSSVGSQAASEGQRLEVAGMLWASTSRMFLTTGAGGHGTGTPRGVESSCPWAPSPRATLAGMGGGNPSSKRGSPEPAEVPAQ